MKRRMTGLLLLSVLTCTVCGAAAADDGGKYVFLDELPQPAQEFLKTHFEELTLELLVEKRRAGITQYEATYTDWTEVEFRADGQWKSVKRDTLAVPAAIVPRAIRDFVQDAAPACAAPILRIERKSHTWEIGLSDGLEIEFDHQFNVVGYDD